MDLNLKVVAQQAATIVVLDLIVGVPWRKQVDDPEKDGKKLKGEILTIDKDHKGK